MVNEIILQTPVHFSMFIEQKTLQTGSTHLETILEFCAQNGIEPDDIASKVTKSLKSKLEADFQNLNYLPRCAQLDL